MNNKKPLKVIKTQNVCAYKIKCKKVKDKDFYYLLKIKKAKDKRFDSLIEELGGVDACFGGLGINGHIAFNEPPEEDNISAEEFGKLGTRVLPISRETKTINAYGYQRGDLRGMPQWCITVGMKQILEAKEIYIALNRPWQHGIVKRVLYDDVQAAIPASLLQNHKNVSFCTYEEVAEGLF